MRSARSVRPLRLLPRSFAAALLGAFALVLLPLAAALLLAMVQLDDLATKSSAASARALEHGAQERAARDALVGLERALRQAEVLGVPALRDTYAAQRERLFVAVDALLIGVPGAPELRETLRRTERRVNGAFRDERLPAALTGFEELSRTTGEAIDAAARQRDAEQQMLSSLPQRVSSSLLWLAGAGVALALVLALLFAQRLGRPVRVLGDAMRRLGEGDLATPVTVRGPSDIARLGERLEWLRQRLDTLEQARSRFLRGVSHDLKTPLAAIAEGAASLDEELYGPLTPPQRSIVGLIRHNGDRLLSRIEHLLRGDRPAADAAPATSAVGKVDLAEVVRNVLDDHHLACAHRRLNVKTELEPAAVVGEADGLRVVVDNLVSNAIKFSPTGAAIELRLERKDGEVHLSVLDEGPGVAPGEEERIFDPAVRGSAAVASGAPGSGHGLSIARDLAQAHGGRLRVAPAGRRTGALFVLSLPVLKESEHAAA